MASPVPLLCARGYSAAAGVVVLAKFGGRFSRNAENASFASAERSRSKNSWGSIFNAASLSWPIDACLRSRLLARNARVGFAASFCAVSVAVASRSRSATTRVTKPSSAARVAVKGFAGTHGSTYGGSEALVGGSPHDVCLVCSRFSDWLGCPFLCFRHGAACAQRIDVLRAKSQLAEDLFAVLAEIGRAPSR